MPPIDLRAKPIAITGASSGIGLATALACARAGMPVALAARRIDRIEAAAARIRGAGGRAIAVPCDVTRPEDCRSLVDRTIAEFGSIYAAFANAGYGLERPVAECSDADLRLLIETNFWGSMNLARPFLDHALPARSGHLLMCSSCLSKIGIPTFAAYCAGKAMQDHFCRAMRHELKPRSIFVSSIHPIGTRTEFFDEAARRSGPAPLMRRPPRLLMQPAQHVADAVVRCLRRPRGEVWTSAATRWLLAAAVAAPALADLALARVRPRPDPRQ